MNTLDRLERLAEYLIEGAFHRLFRPASGKKSSPPEETRELVAVPRPAGRQWRLELNNRQISLAGPVVTIGRGPDNDIILGDPAVSRHHAQLRWRDGRYYLHLLTASAGPPVPLAAGTQFQLGQTTLRVVVN
ncbi:MAG: FHA domain-containing protein [Chloroflexi bacterium]|nr:MAG: FHA domain-containing protein [Chloroflexota bacterium]